MRFWMKWLWDIRPRLKGALFKWMYLGKQVKIGKNFRCDTFPELWITDKGRLEIGNDVYLKRNVEMRVHKQATLRLGDRVKIDRGVRLLTTNEATLDVREGARVGLSTVFNGGDSITVGKNVLISGYVYIQTSMHRHLLGVDVQKQGYDHAPIMLDDDVWLGAHVVILPGVTMGHGAIAGSNAVVTRDVGANEVVAGIPAKPIRQRKEGDE